MLAVSGYFIYSWNGKSYPKLRQLYVKVQGQIFERATGRYQYKTKFAQILIVDKHGDSGVWGVM